MPFTNRDISTIRWLETPTRPWTAVSRRWYVSHHRTPLQLNCKSIGHAEAAGSQTNDTQASRRTYTSNLSKQSTQATAADQNSRGGSILSKQPSQQQSSQAHGPSPASPASADSGNAANLSSSRTAPADQHQQEFKHAVVVGGGWAGFGAALALAKAGAKVTLLDASENPGGLSSAFVSSGGQVVEPGIKGFWYQYSNIESLVSSELNIPDPFTPFTTSSFWSPQGLQVESPIFQDLPRLPSPLGSFIHTAPLFRNLSLIDRATAVPLVKPLLEHDLDEDMYRYYDGMSAYELFRSAGVSHQLYDTFLAPMLLVTLFAPPTELSAAAALGALYYFALAHQPDFDVRWCRGPIGDLIFKPLVQKLKTLGVNILGGRRGIDIVHQELDKPYDSKSNSNSGIPNPTTIIARGPGGVTERYNADVIVLAAGIPALQKLVTKSRVLAAADDLRGVLSVGCSDVLAVRLWLDQKLVLRSSSNVVAGFDEGVGGTFFHLNELQDMYRDESGSVIEFDLYHAESLLPLSDDALITHLLQTYLTPALPRGLSQAQTLTVKDSSVLRFRNAVTRFSPGSNSYLPGITTSIPSVFVAGDCVKQGPGSHGCKGLSQEKAYVSGLQAGNAAAVGLGLAPVARVLPVEPDEPHVAAAKDLLKLQRQIGTAVQDSLFSNSSSRTRTISSSESSSTKINVQRGVSSSSVSGGSDSSGEQRAEETRQFRQLLREEMAEQVDERGQQQQQQHQGQQQQQQQAQQQQQRVMPS